MRRAAKPCPNMADADRHGRAVHVAIDTLAHSTSCNTEILPPQNMAAADLHGRARVCAAHLLHLLPLRHPAGHPAGRRLSPARHP